jgi:DNA-binding transcriptional LysR family regulator
MINEQRLKSFLVVVRRRNLTAAADELHITQPALSIQMKHLEAYYKAQLFKRKGRSIELTPAGQALQLYAKQILDLIRVSQEAISELPGNRARVCIGGGTTSGPYVLAELLGAFRRLHPKTEIVMRLGQFEELLHMFARGEIDISLSRLPRSVDGYGLQQETFANVEMVFAASPKHYLCKQRKAPSLKQIAAQEQFILTPPGNASRELIDSYCAQRDIQLDTAMEFESIEAIKSAVRENFGVSILSKPSVALEVESNKLNSFKVDGLEISYPLVILYPAKRKLSEAAELFLHFLRHKK